jgi:uncharacterized iron-regulated membrane protein
MSFKKIAGWLHLWLGLISGTIMLVVCLTGCIWVFNEEINGLFQPWKKVEKQERPYLKPSEIAAHIQTKIPEDNIRSVSYKNGETARVWLYEKDKYSIRLNINPYTGEILHKIDFLKKDFDFFSFILRGHRFLWFPWKIGRPIVNYATLTFVVILTTGLILWWPKNKSAAKQRFWFKWKDTTQWKRKNYDIHNIAGFYAMIFLLIIALTGITWGLSWFNKSVYWAVSGGQEKPKWEVSKSDTLNIDKAEYTLSERIDQVWAKVVSKHPYEEEISIYWPEQDDPAASIGAYVYPKAFDGFQYDSYNFDQYTLAPIPRSYFGEYKNANAAEKLERMYYGIHVGSILGLPGKILAFLASFLGATLPVTGVYIWWGRRKKNKKTNSGERKTITVEKTAGTKTPSVKFKPKITSK